MGRPDGPPTKTVTVVLAKATYLRIAALAVEAEMPVSSYVRKDLEARYPEQRVTPVVHAVDLARDDAN